MKRTLSDLRGAIFHEDFISITLEEAKIFLGQIQHFSDEEDDERAHEWEDFFHKSVLYTLSQSGLPLAEMRELAALAHSTHTICFSRWCA